MVDLDNILRQSLAQQQAKSAAQTQPETGTPEPEARQEPIPAKQELKDSETAVPPPVEKRKREVRSRGKETGEDPGATSKPPRNRASRDAKESDMAEIVAPYRPTWSAGDSTVHLLTEVYLKLRTFSMFHGVPISALIGYIVDQYLQKNWNPDMDVLLKLLKDKKI